ncbi:zinc transporter ZntB [Marinomonas pollencensis]|uniref:Zinc transporter n=1 Tax=Marinomonas pollencensis TaxID=491954 RepID=A0A3E0DLD7_9GAMM|nr:zinc transporter ZntB [Marinomonas pollencensis]REG82343.1 zinc transporter [Marinomonas pollencensis]
MSDFIVHHLELNGQGGATLLDHQLLPNKVPKEGGRWVHIDFSKGDAREWLSTVEDMPEAVVEALCAEETRPRSTKIGQGVLVTLRGVNLNPGSNPSDMVSLRLWVTPHFIVSSRRRRLLSVQDIVKDLSVGDGPINSADLMTILAQTLTGRMASVIDDLEDELAELEENLIQSTAASDQRSSLVQRRIETVRLRRFLVPQKEAIQRLAVESQAWLTKEQVVQLQESANDITRYVEALESLRERCLFMQEEFVNLQSEKMNARMYVLSILSAIFLPLGFLTGLFGINIGGMPGTESGMAFWLFCGVLVVLGIGQFIVMRKSRWF